MHIVYKQDGLDQLPLRWRPHLNPITKANGGRATALPVTFEDVDGESQTALLINGALGGLQLVDYKSGKVLDKVRPVMFCTL